MQEESNTPLPKPRRSNEERRAQTRQALIEAARKCFSENGYAETGTPQIVSEAGVTRGALYHHFSDKADLLRGVLEAETKALAQAIDRESLDETSAVSAMISGGRAYLQAMQAPGRAALLLIDGPAVLGPQEMARINGEGPDASLREGLRALLGPALDEASFEALARMVSAGFDAAAAAIAQGGDIAPHVQAFKLLFERLGSKAEDQTREGGTPRIRSLE